MPRYDLRGENGKLHPLAPFKVLAVMCHPTDRAERERLLGTTEKETGAGRPRRKPLPEEALMQEVRHASRRGTIAGGLLLTMVQLWSNGYRATLNTAIPLVTALLPKWQQPESVYWSKICHYGHHPHSRTNMLRAYGHYRSVAHLWAALLHGQQHDLQDVWPGSTTTLPTFLSYAEAILRHASRIPSSSSGRRFLVTRSEAWHFTIPNGIRPAHLEGLPLNEEQLALLNEQKVANQLV